MTMANYVEALERSSTPSIPSLKNLVVNKTAKFQFFRENVLYYAVDGFVFPVPADDTGNGTFLAEDRAIFYMRWIRKEMKSVEEKAEQVRKLKAEFQAEHMKEEVGKVLDGLAQAATGGRVTEHFDGTRARLGAATKVIELPKDGQEAFDNTYYKGTPNK